MICSTGVLYMRHAAMTTRVYSAFMVNILTWIMWSCNQSGTHKDRLECGQDKIIGSGCVCLLICLSFVSNCLGCFDENNLLFLAKAGVMKLQLKKYKYHCNLILVIILHSLELSSKYTSAVKKVKKHSMRRSLLPQEMATDDHLNVLKRAFQCYCEGNTVSVRISSSEHLLIFVRHWQCIFWHCSNSSYVSLLIFEIMVRSTCTQSWELDRQEKNWDEQTETECVSSNHHCTFRAFLCY